MRLRRGKSRSGGPAGRGQRSSRFLLLFSSRGIQLRLKIGFDFRKKTTGVVAVIEVMSVKVAEVAVLG